MLSDLLLTANPFSNDMGGTEDKTIANPSPVASVSIGSEDEKKKIKNK